MIRHLPGVGPRPPPGRFPRDFPRASAYPVAVPSDIRAHRPREVQDQLRTLVLIPACNEEDRIPSVVEDARQVLPEATIVVVDDGSRDRTAEAAEKAGAVVLRLLP